MSLNYFASLTQDQINSSSTTTYIQDVQQDLQTQIINLDDETQVNPALNQWVSDGNTTVYGNNPSLVSVGTNNNILNDGDQIVNVGSQNTNKNADNSVIIGHQSVIQSDDSGNMNNYNVLIGNISNMNLAGGGVQNNVMIASGANLTGSNNILIGGYAPNNTSNISNTVNLLQAPVNTNFGSNPIINGSVIISSSASGGTPSGLPKVQFLSEHLTNLRGQNAGDAYNDAVNFAVPNISGYLRLKYKGKNIKIAVYPDDDASPCPDPI